MVSNFGFEPLTLIENIIILKNIDGLKTIASIYEPIYGY